MSLPAPGPRIRRFLIALTLFIVGPMTLPDGPLHGDRLMTLSRGALVFVRGFRLLPSLEASASAIATSSNPIAESPGRRLAHSRDLPPGGGAHGVQLRLAAKTSAEWRAEQTRVARTHTIQVSCTGGGTGQGVVTVTGVR